MKKKVTFEKNIEFPTMIGEICEISLDHELKFVDEFNVSGDLVLTGKYKMTEASRLEDDFNYRIPVEITLTERVNLNTTNIEISDFYYEIENDNILICHIELLVEGLEVVDDDEKLALERECDGDIINKEIEIPILENKNEDNEIGLDNSFDIVNEDKNEENINSLFSNLDDENDQYGTFVVYIVRQNETINSIIEKYNTTVEELEKYNDLKEINIGTKLIIPLVNE